MEIGSDTHKELYCSSFLSAHRTFEPEDLPWPDLDEEGLFKLRGIPFWEEALANEIDAGAMIDRLAATIEDPMVREAVALQGFEEARHARILRHLIARYEIETAEPEPEPEPDDLRTAFIHFGYSECLDSFGAYGIFQLAKEASYFPPGLFEIFDQVLQEEAQHTVFFLNWLAHELARQGKKGWPHRAMRSMSGYGKAIGRLVELANSDDDTQEGFTTTGGSSFIDDLTPAAFVGTCVRENRRRMAAIDERLLRPRLLPSLAQAGLPFLKLIPIKAGTLSS